MHQCADAARLTPAERLREVASILAIGILRLRQPAALPTEDSQKKPPGLNVASVEGRDETVLSVRNGLPFPGIRTSRRSPPCDRRDEEAQG